MENLRARDYRRKASDACKPYSGRLALITLIYLLIMAVVAYIPLAILILGGPFTIGYIIVVKKTVNSTEPAYEDIFGGFNDKIGSSIVTYILETIFVFLWSLLLIIPGIIKSYAYAMSMYLVNDEGLSGTEAITKSRELMHGNKWKLFCLDLSYIGWWILCILTFGILTLWVNPKFETARYLFYLHISGKDAVKTEQIEAEVKTEE